jgi:hypothetical protein
VQKVKDYINAHRKALIAAVVAVVIVVAPDADADMIAAIVGALLTLLVPNDQVAIQRVYHRKH